jgi:glutaminase
MAAMEPERAEQVQERLEELYERHRPEGDAPFAISLVGVEGEAFHAGDREERFPLQSISKIFAYMQALEDHGREKVLEHVSVEPSGEAFNSFAFDRRRARPYNPMVNAGAMVTTSLVQGADDAERLARLVAEASDCAGAKLEVDEAVVQHELRETDHNRAAAYLMRGHGMLDPETDVEALLELYLRQCAISVTTPQLATMAATLANGGVNPVTGERTLSERNLRDVLSVMHTCGMYDFAGQWAFEVGVPAKSGVSGGILAVIPGKFGIGVFSPELDEYGNSILGVRVCEDLSERLGLHVFAAAAEDALLGPGAVRG